MTVLTLDETLALEAKIPYIVLGSNELRDIAAQTFSVNGADCLQSLDELKTALRASPDSKPMILYDPREYPTDTVLKVVETTLQTKEAYEQIVGIGKAV